MRRVTRGSLKLFALTFPFFRQAFLDDHVELRASASFGDVSAMVEHWMSLEDGNDAENLEDENGMDALSF